MATSKKPSKPAAKPAKATAKPAAKPAPKPTVKPAAKATPAKKVAPKAAVKAVAKPAAKPALKAVVKTPTHDAAAAHAASAHLHAVPLSSRKNAPTPKWIDSAITYAQQNPAVSLVSLIAAVLGILLIVS